MQSPLDQEAATADLVTDIIAPSLHRSSAPFRGHVPWDLTGAEISDLARDLSAGSIGWRDAWALGPIRDDQEEPTQAARLSRAPVPSSISPTNGYQMTIAAQSGRVHAEANNMGQTRTSAPADRTAVDQTADLAQGLSRAEDDELRRLHWLSQIGSLAGRKAERLLELRLRDRRKEIRAPREFAEEKVEVRGGTRRRWYNFRSR